jgi:winged helix DNA-binding protein
VTAAAELAIAARVEGLTQADVRAELWERRTLVKTWTMRGTLHLHPADELPLWASATRAVGPPWYESYGLNASQGTAVLDAIGDALDGRCLLREELADEVASRAGEWTREKIASGWGYIIGSAAAVGKLCHGPPQGSKVTFVRTDQWSGWFDVEPRDALAEVCRRYLAAYGPATPREFAEWFAGRTFVGEARRVFESIEGELEEVDVEGRTAWVVRGGELTEPGRADSLRLLPEYDCYVMGFREREHFVPDAARELVRAHPRGKFEGLAGAPTLLVNGVVSGVWRRAKRGKRIEIILEPLGRLTASKRRLVESEAERIGSFLGAEPHLRVGSLSA